jgi:TatA/E family protein of Tat protein translocase
MFGSIGLPELIMIFVIALLLFGPKQLPNLGRTLGRALAEFKRASNDLQRTLEEEVRAEELRSVGQEVAEATRLPQVLSPAEQEVVSAAQPPTAAGGQGSQEEKGPEEGSHENAQ